MRWSIIPLIAIKILSTISLASAIENYPEKPVSIIVPFAPGGLTDVQTRLIAAHLETRLGQPVIIENKPGALGQIGAQFVASAPPDGYTLLVAGSSMFVSGPVMREELTYDPLRDFDMVAIVAQVPMVLAVPAALGVDDMEGLVDYVKSQEQPVKYGTSGIGSSSHITSARLMRLVGADADVVPYTGTAGALVDVAGNRLTFVIESPGSMAPHVEAGNIKLLAVFAQSRLPSFPDLPTIGEAGFPEAMNDTWEFWQGISVRTGTSPEIISKLNASINEAIEASHESLRDMGLVPVLDDEHYAQERLKNDIETIVPLLIELGFEAQ